MRLECAKISSDRQVGSTLIVSVLMMLIVLVAGTSMASIALMEEKAARNQRDRTVALQSAELALVDAEHDIENSTATTSRSFIFSPVANIGFTENCGQGNSNIYQGLCLAQDRSKSEINLTLSGTDSNSGSVQFGRFTGQTMPIGHGLPCRLPRYIIELINDNAPGQVAQARYLYRITAIGFGADCRTHVVFQSVYRKAVG